MCYRLLLTIACLALLAPAWAAASADDNPLPNAGFEEGEQGWRINDAISFAVSDAARSGELGMRVGSVEPSSARSSVTSARFAVTGGQEVTVSFWGRCAGHRPTAAVALIFRADDGGWLAHPEAAVRKTDGQWSEYSFSAAAPDEASTVEIWIHSYARRAGVTDVDDLAIAGLAAGVKVFPAAATQRPKPPEPIDAASVPARKTPPIIILKLDDLRQKKYSGPVHPRWQKVADYLREKKIKAGFGMICETLEEATPQYVEWICSRQEAGEIEFWFHGWDHAVHEQDGKKYNEFNGRSYEDQKQRLEKSQALAREKLGFAFRAFGPPGGVGSGSFNQDTLGVMVEDPDIRVMLYPGPLNDAGREAMASSGGKFVILDRVWNPRLERPLFVPNFEAFLRDYTKHPDRTYFVLQGHPAHWTDEGFQQFTRIIDFLVSQKAVFMTPTEAAHAIEGEAAAAP